MSRRDEDLQRSREIGTHTSAEWWAVIAKYSARCAYCAKQAQLTKDHITPIRQGGSDAIENIVPACRRCNSMKNARTGWGFVAGVPRALAFGVPLVEAEALIAEENRRAVQQAVDAHLAGAAAGDGADYMRARTASYRSRLAANRLGVTNAELCAAIAAVGLDPHVLDATLPRRTVSS